jgi:hypothetical protein
LDEIEQFSKFHSELKSFLVSTISEEYILKHIHSIPDFDLDALENSNAEIFYASILGSFLGLIGILNKDRKKINAAKEIIRDVKGKYASLEFLLKNHY